MQKTKRLSDSASLIGVISKKIAATLMKILFIGSQKYWQVRYAIGGTSGAGSCGKWAEFKAEVLNSFVKGYGISSVIEFGCGDGNQLSLANYPAYVGLDVSKTAIKRCKERFKHDKAKSFCLYTPDYFVDTNSTFTAQLALSLDVIYHLVEDRIFELYMKHLFSSAEKFVIIYSTDSDVNYFFQFPHVKHRRFSEYVKINLPQWKLIRKIPNKYLSQSTKQTPTPADFFIYEKL